MRLIHTHIMHTFTATHKPRAWTCVSRDGAEARGNKMQSAPQQSHSEAANGLYLMGNFQNKTSRLFKFTEAISLSEKVKKKKQPEVLRPRRTHRQTRARTRTHGHHKPPGVRWSVAEIMATSSSSIRASQTKQTSSF